MACFSKFYPAPLNLADLLEDLSQTLQASSVPPSWMALFGSELDDSQLAAALAAIRDRFPETTLVGCTAESLVHDGSELEQTPGLSLLACALPGAEIEAFRLEYTSTPEGAAFVGWPESPLAAGGPPQALLALGDPFSFPMDLWLERMNEDYPGMPIVGGMASAGMSPGDNRLWINDQIASTGAVILRLGGNLSVATVVSQGCRPIGEPMVITEVERNAIRRLGGKPALEVLRDLWQSLPTSEQRLLQQGLQIGRVVDEASSDRQMGDFLIRSVSGIEPDLAALVVGDFFRPGQTVQFHLRDEVSASHELTQLLDQLDPSQAFEGGLLFTCNGRGTRLFSEPHHDAGQVQKRFPNLALVGFFAAGEIGPVAGTNFFHGFTASALLLGAKQPPEDAA